MDKLDKPLLGKRDKPDPAPEEEPEKSHYHFKEGLRFVHPYSHSFTCHAKRRWIGQLLIDIYSDEFKAFSADYYAKAIEAKECSGEITVNGKQVGLNYRIKDGDYILHKTTREETPVYEALP